MNSATDNKQGAVESDQPVGDASSEDVIHRLRRFHYGEPQAAQSTRPPGGAILPALLNPYRDASAIRYQYPIYLLPADEASESVLAKPLGEHLSDALQALAPGDTQAMILKDNLPWLSTLR